MPTNSSLVKYLIILLLLAGFGYFIYDQYDKWQYKHNATEYFANKLTDDLAEQMEKASDNKQATFACLINSYSDETCVTPDPNTGFSMGSVLMFYNGSPDGSINESTVVLNKYNYSPEVTVTLNNNLLLIESDVNKNNFNVLINPSLLNRNQQPYMVMMNRGDSKVCPADNIGDLCGK